MYTFLFLNANICNIANELIYKITIELIGPKPDNIQDHYRIDSP